MNSEVSIDVNGGVSNQDEAPAIGQGDKPEGALGNRRRSPASVGFEVVEPWPDPVNGAELLDKLTRELQRFVVLSKWAAETFALWILHSYAYRLRDVTTYIGIAGTGVREIDVVDGVKPVGGPGGTVVEYQSIGIVPVDRGTGADIVNRRGGHEFAGER